MNKNAKWAVLMAGILWGGISLFVRHLSAAGFGLIQMVLIRCFFGSLMMGGALAIKSPEKLKINIKDVWVFVGTGIISLLIFNLCYMYTMTQGQAAVGAVLLYTSPVFIMILSRLFFKEKITSYKIIALILTIIGCVFVSGYMGGESIAFMVLLMGILSGFFYGLYTIFGKVALKKYDSATVTFYTFIFAMIGSLPLAKVSDMINIYIADPMQLLWSAGIGFFCTVAPYFLYTWGLDRMDSGQAAIIVAVEPLVGAILGMAVYGEDRSVLKIIGIITILVAIVIGGSTPKRKNAQNK